MSHSLSEVCRHSWGAQPAGTCVWTERGTAVDLKRFDVTPYTLNTGRQKRPFSERSQPASLSLSSPLSHWPRCRVLIAIQWPQTTHSFMLFAEKNKGASERMLGEAYASPVGAEVLAQASDLLPQAPPTGPAPVAVPSASLGATERICPDGALDGPLFLLLFWPSPHRVHCIRNVQLLKQKS